MGESGLRVLLDITGKTVQHDVSLWAGWKNKIHDENVDKYPVSQEFYE